MKVAIFRSILIIVRKGNVFTLSLKNFCTVLLELPLLKFSRVTVCLKSKKAYEKAYQLVFELVIQTLGLLNLF